MNYSTQHVVNTPPYGNQDSILHENPPNVSGNVSPYYVNSGNTYQMYHPLQSIPTTPSPQPANISPPATAAPLYTTNVAPNYNYGSSWHPSEYFSNPYPYQGASTSDYLPVVADIE